jgi:UDPglucose 6-dehydrogenase
LGRAIDGKIRGLQVNHAIEAAVNTKHHAEGQALKISVIGLGKLGSPMAAVLADKGHDVIGVDVNAAFVQALREGRAPVRETGLDDLVAKNRARLSATIHYDEAVLGSELTFIIVPTPSQADGTFSIELVLAACRNIGDALRRKSAFHVAVVTSTVMPGATGGPIRACLEEASGKVCGKDFGLCYNPEFIALGSVIRDMMHPDFILIGESDPRSGDILAGLYEKHWDPKPAVRRMGFVNAELTKISVNTYVTTKITYANMLARLCERLPGADCDVVTQALGFDSRIGHKYLKGALGFGGPCFPRDNVAFNSLARQIGAKAYLAEATDRFNREQVGWVADELLRRLPAGGRIGILGLSYKPNTGVVEESQAVALAHCIAAKDVPVVVYDPQASDQARPILQGKVRFAESMSDCAREADLLLIATPWDEFRRLSPADLKRGGRKPVVVDCWRILPEREFASAAELIVMGLGPKA